MPLPFVVFNQPNGPSGGAPWSGMAGPLLINSAAETIISPTNPDFQFGVHTPQPFQGQTIYVFAQGIYNSASTAPTLRIRLRWGGLAGGLLLDTGAVTMAASQASSTSWSLEGNLSFRALTVNSLAFVAYGRTYGVGSTTTAMAQVPTTGSQTQGAVNIQLGNALVLTGQFNTASASNTCQVQQFWVAGSGMP